MKNLFLYLFLSLSASSFAQNWNFDLEQAKTKAQKEQKEILLVFSGSDWCAPCIKLDQEIWQSEEFKNHAKDKLVLLKADFPKRKNNRLPEEQQQKNNLLAEQYNPNGHFPFVVLLNANGEVVNQLGYKNLSPAKYIQAIYGK